MPRPPYNETVELMQRLRAILAAPVPEGPLSIAWRDSRDTAAYDLCEDLKRQLTQEGPTDAVETAHERCECGAEGFTKLISEVLMLGGFARPEWVPDTPRVIVLCLPCLQKASGMTDQILEAVEEVVKEIDPRDEELH